MDDGVVSERVRTALAADASAQARGVVVDTRGGIVQLNGLVDTDGGRDQARRVAEGVSGVQGVENNLELRDAVPQDGNAGGRPDVAGMVRLALAANPATRGFDISVAAHGGQVQLGGWVDSDLMRNLAGQLAQSVNGVTGVVNSLDVRR